MTELSEDIIVHYGEDEIRIEREVVLSTLLALRAINHDLRRQIIALLDRQEEMTVTDIYVSLKIDQSTASQHLRQLRRAKIVGKKKRGKFAHYRLEKSRMADIARLVNQL